VATRLLAREDARSLVVIGAGAQAEWQVRAVVAVRPIERITVCTRSPGTREALAARMREVTGLDVGPSADVETALRSADVVCCATTSSEPVFDAGWLRPGTHVNGIGAFRLGMVELPPELFAAAAVVAVDSRVAALAEAGDVVAAIERGLLAEPDLVEIGVVERSWVASRDPQAITAFKSVGLAIQDVAASELIVSRLLRGREPEPGE
jgi:ornithine cyclodeaminase